MPMTDRALVCFLALSSIALGQESSSSTATMVTAAIAKSNLISFVQPDYPQLAKVASIAGKVRAEIIVSLANQIVHVDVLRNAYFDFGLNPRRVSFNFERFIFPLSYRSERRGREHGMSGNQFHAGDVSGLVQEVFWLNQKAGQEAFDKNDLALAESKLLVARSAAEERGPQKWLGLCGVITLLANIKFKEDDFEAAENLYKESLALHEKHQRPDEAEVAGAQQDLAYLYFRMGRPNDAETLYRKSVETYERRFRETSASAPLAAYGRHLAIGYFALSQIARSGQHPSEAEDSCKKAISYAELWSDSENPRVITTTCEALVQPH